MKMLFSILQLIRLPNIFTAISNVWAGALIANYGKFPIPNILFGIVATVALYGGSLTFNDYCDRNYDRVYNPKRPIPSGSVSAQAALLIAGTLLALGAASGFLISLCGGVITCAIALSAVLYDGLLKMWFLPAIVSMGLCRGLGWALGLEAGGTIYGLMLLFPVAIFVYTAALTAISRFEVEKPIFKKVVMGGILLIPLIDGSIVFAYGYWWQGLIVGMLIVPVVVLSKKFDMT